MTSWTKKHFQKYYDVIGVYKGEHVRSVKHTTGNLMINDNFKLMMAYSKETASL